MTAPSPAPAEKPATCPECGTQLAGKYCHLCGTKLPDPHDLTLRHFLHEGLHELTHVDAKIFLTLRTLLFRPGVLSAEYLAGRRNRYVLPLRLFLVIFALYLFLYTRPGVALYDFHFVLSQSEQGKKLDTKLQHTADNLHLTKDALFERINERWQRYASLFQLGDVFFFAVWLALVNWRRYFVEHLIFPLHTLSFSFLIGSAAWLYYARYGFRQNWVLVLTSFGVLLLYLWRSIPRMYGSTGWKALLKSVLVLIGLEISRIFFLIFTLVLALVHTFRTH